VGAYVFLGLESHNFSRWPSGNVYRRGFVRDYAQSIGLPVEETLAEFERLFPDVLDDGQATEPVRTDEPGDRLRLALAGRARAIPVWSPRRAAGAGFDLITVLVVASLGAWASGLGLGATLGIVAFCYYSLGTVILGRSLWAWWLTDGAACLAEPRLAARSWAAVPGAALARPAAPGVSVQAPGAAAAARAPVPMPLADAPGSPLTALPPRSRRTRRERQAAHRGATGDGAFIGHR
jgi:hypothetical protein